MATIYRIACKTDVYKGMYHHGPATAIFDDQWDGVDRHPAPFEDSKLSEPWRTWVGKAYFGFASLSQLRRWIYRDNWLVELDYAGQVLYVIEVPDTDFAEGHTQAIFSPFDARVVQRRSLLTLLES